jgi:hypothetical protein
VVPEAALMVSVLVAGLEFGETEPGLNVQLAPDGRPEQARVTGPLNPFNPLAEMLSFTELPALTEALLGEALMLKSPGAIAGALNVAICMTQLPLSRTPALRLPS